MEKHQSSFIAEFFQKESSGGILLMLTTVAAVLAANSPLEPYYRMTLSTPVMLRIGDFEIAKPLLLWINDGLMAVFFFLIGLELKREMVEGELSDVKKIILPGIGAIGGMAIPALIYVLFNMGDPVALKGWAIPAATDIAFALGILALLGSRVPIAIKIFLTSLAIFDDVGAIVIIALFYTDKISLTALLVVGVCLAVLLVFNRKNITIKSPYLLVGLIMWAAMLKSGVHATLAGVALAMFIPLRCRKDADLSPLKTLEHDLHAAVVFFILPVFAFANAGLGLGNMGMDKVLHSVPLGIALGLFLGKQVGIFGFCWLAVRMKIASLPQGMDWSRLYGTAALCGVGFTMSLFIGSLAFDASQTGLLFDERLGIIMGSTASGLLGYFVLKASLNTDKTAD